LKGAEQPNSFPEADILGANSDRAPNFCQAIFQSDHEGFNSSFVADDRTLPRCEGEHSDDKNEWESEENRDEHLCAASIEALFFRQDCARPIVKVNSDVY
jgi:hypothetical protein